MSKRTLLLADDSVTIQKVVNLTFADEGIEVITVGDGDAAMEKIAESVPDIVLADVHMPGLSGYRICEILRQNPATEDLPVVLLVGSFEPFDESEAARVGASAYLTKPFQSIRQLVSQVTDLMGASAPALEPSVPEEETVEDSEVPVEDPEVTDIDYLYKQSVAEQEAAAAEHNQSVAEEEGAGEADAGSPLYVDSGMDDEMIETSSGAGEVEESPATGTDEVLESDSSLGGTGAFESFADDRSEMAAAATASPEATSGFDEFSRTDQMPAFEQPASRNEFGLDEIELLELPPIDSADTLEFTTAPGSIGGGATKQVVSLTPELMDLIVQKVVEKLAEKH